MLPYISIPFEHVGTQIGTAPDDLKQVGTFLFSFPLAGLLKRVPDARPEYKNIFIISCSLFYLIGLFDLWHGLATIAFAAGGAFAIAKFLRTSPYMPWIGFVFLMGHLSISHLVRQQVGDAGKIDITGVHMVMVMKLTAFCWNVADGVLPEQGLSDFQKDRRLLALPSLLDYAGYVLFFPGLFAGPAFDFVEYRRWLDCSMFDLPANVDATKKPPTRRRRKIPRSGTPAMLKLGQGLLYLGLYIYLLNYFDWPLLLSPRFLGYGFARRVWTMYMVNLTARLKYYGSWSLTEGACVLTGLGYNGVDPATGKVSWNRLENIDPLGVELAQNARGYLGHWNMNTSKWLRNYVFLRVTPRGKKPGFRATLATFTTSAFWHGLQPGYYLTFVLGALVQTAAKNSRRYLRPFFLDPKTQAALPSKRFYDAASFIATQIVFAFVTTPFLVLNLSDSLEAWRRVHYFAVFATAANLLLFASPVKGHLRRALEQRAARAGVVTMPKTGKKEAANGSAAKEEDDHQERRDPARSNSTDSSIADSAPLLGLSQDVGKDLDDAMQEIKEDLEMETARAEFESHRSNFEHLMAKKKS